MDDGSPGQAAPTTGPRRHRSGWLLGGHALDQLHAIAEGVDPRLLVMVRWRPPTPLAEMRLEDLTAKLADLADQAADVIEELDRRADHIRNVAGYARASWNVRK